MPRLRRLVFLNDAAAAAIYTLSLHDALPIFRVLAQAQQGQRHADVVVQVPFGRERRVAEPGPQDGRDHLRHRGLAVAARSEEHTSELPVTRPSRMPSSA